MSDPIVFEVHGLPCSVNASYVRRSMGRGGPGLMLSQKARAWKTAVKVMASMARSKVRLLKGGPLWPTEEISVSLLWIFSDRRRRDVDGPIKGTLDSLEGIFVSDDSQITSLSSQVRRGDPTGPKVTIAIGLPGPWWPVELDQLRRKALNSAKTETPVNKADVPGDA